VFVCDAYDAMVSDRPYAKSMAREKALTELRDCAGTMFDPQVVDAFCAAAPRLKEAVEKTALPAEPVEAVVNGSNGHSAHEPTRDPAVPSN
jgi:HD-GYP domain-containing protein (c-di-GMP phosphodiesterase class II)